MSSRSWFIVAAFASFVLWHIIGLYGLSKIKKDY